MPAERAVDVTRRARGGSRTWWRRRALPRSRSPRRGAVVAGLVLTLLGGTGVVVLAAVHDTYLPGPGLFGASAPLVVAVYGPPLVGAGSTAAALAWALRARLPRAGTVVALTTFTASVALAVPVAALVAAALGAGGAIDVVDALALTDTTPSAPDSRPVYTTGPDGEALHLAVVRPVGADGPAPVMVFVHGGGWVGGSELARSADMRRLAGQGWLVIGIEYTLAREGRPTWDIAGPQVACALTRIAAHAAEAGGDPSRVVLLGDSAGGQLVVSVGYHAASGSQPSSCGGRVPVPLGVVAEYPAVDLVDGYEHGAASPVPFLDAPSLAVAYTGGTPAEVPERYRAISGTAAITAAAPAPATLVLGPTEDSLVPPAGVARFAEAARAAGVDAELVRIPFADHAFDAFATGSLGHQTAITIIEHWSRDRVGVR